MIGLVEDKDYVDFGEAFIKEFGHCHLYQPLSYKGSVTLASNKVPPIRDNGAKWCISYQKTSEYWHIYTKKGIKFLFAFTKYTLTIYPKKMHLENEVYTFEDSNIGWPEWCRSSEIVECIANLKEISKPSLAELLDKYKETLIKNPDGTIDKVSYKKVDLSDFVKNGHFICQFSKWEGTFDCSRCNLVSLEGAPKKVRGSFYCNNNQLSSFEEGPEYIGGGVMCYGNPKLGTISSTKGIPSYIGKYMICSLRFKRALERIGAPFEIRVY